MLRVSGLGLPDLNPSEHSDQVKKLLKYLADVCRKMEERHQSADRVEDVFSLELLGLRTRMRDYVLRMLSLDPTKSGIKVLEQFWRKCYHEPYSVVRQLRGSGWTKSQASLIQSHLLSGMGTYQNLILHLVEKFGWEGHDATLDFIMTRQYGFGSLSVNTKAALLDPDTEEPLGPAWVESCVIRCLVWLGDLARYLETDLTSSAAISATHYYRLASVLGPDTGQPLNNLAMLAGGHTNWGLDQLYLYLKCVCCKLATDNGQANLKRLLDKPIEYGSDGRNLVSGLLQLVKIVFDGEGLERVTSGCRHSLTYIHTCLEVIPGDLAGPWLGFSVSIVILLIQHKAEPVCQAWMMAILSHLAGKIVTNVLKKFPDLEVKEVEEDVIEESKEVKEDVKRRKNKLESMMRRRRAGSEEENSEESSDETVESDEDLDDVEEGAESDDDFMVESSSDEDVDDVVVEAPPAPTQRMVVDAANEGHFLSGFILCQTWLTQHPYLLAQTGQGSEQMWQNMANLFNVLYLEPRDSLIASEDVNAVIEDVKAHDKQPPLPEDWLIRGHNSEADGKITWNAVEESKHKENSRRVLRVEEFRKWLIKHADSKITWDSDRKTARFKKAVEEADKKNVMKHMAELWLRQEVKDLEKEVVQDGGIVVVDSRALVTGLSIVRRTLGLKRFTLVIPTVTIRELDMLKKTERGAREAIRWLERELSRGNHWLRAQKPEEVVELEKGSSTLTRDQVKLLQCLTYFSSKSGGERVILLSGDQDTLNGDKDFLADIKDRVSVENVEGFLTRMSGVPYRGPRVRKRTGRGKRGRDSENIG